MKAFCNDYILSSLPSDLVLTGFLVYCTESYYFRSWTSLDAFSINALEYLFFFEIYE